MTEEFEEPMGLEIRTDSTAARGIIQRSCSGRIKHLQVKQLWVQERETKRDLHVAKFPREKNVADLLTHHFSDAEWFSLSHIFGVERRPFSRCVGEGGC